MRMYALGIVLVHGIGHQKRSQTRDVFQESLATTMNELGYQVSCRNIDETSAKLSFAEGKDSVLLTEAWWAPTVENHRENGWRGTRKRAEFLLTVLPYLFIGAIGPRSNDPLLATDGDSSAKLEEHRKYLPSFWRMMTLAAIVAALYVGFSTYALVTTAVLAAVVVLLLLFIAHRSNLVEHVRLASRGTRTFAALDETIATTLTSAARSCRELWVIGHSQGGFLAHRIITADSGKRRKKRSHKQVTRLIGIASGLRPITLAGYALTGVRAALYGWGMLVPSAMWGFGLVIALSDGGFLRFPQIEFFFTAAPAIISNPLAMRFLELFHASLNEPIIGGWGGLGWMAGGLAWMVVLWLIRKKLDPKPIEISDIPQRIQWDEWTSPSDIVGSMGVPTLPREGIARVLPSVRSPLLDHGLARYLGKRSVLRFLLSTEIADKVGVDNAMSTERTARVTTLLTELDRSCYLLRGCMVLCGTTVSACVVLWLQPPALVVVTTVLISGVVSSLFGWLLAVCRWRLMAPRIVLADSMSLAVCEAKAQSRVLPRWVRRSLVVLGVLAILTSVGLVLSGVFAVSQGAEMAFAKQFSIAGVTSFFGTLGAAFALTLGNARIRGTGFALAALVFWALQSLRIVNEALPDVPIWFQPGAFANIVIIVLGTVVLIRLAALRLESMRDMREAKSMRTAESPPPAESA